LFKKIIRNIDLIKKFGFYVSKKTVYKAAQAPKRLQKFTASEGSPGNNGVSR
jgi:hypothetical protein